MNAFLHEILAPHNLPYSMLLVMVLIYWLTVFIGAIDLDFLDIDLDVDTDADISAELDADLEMDSDVDSETSLSGGGMTKILAFFNVGAVPFMIFFSFLVLNLWIGSVLGNFYLAGQNTWFPWAWVVPNLAIALFMTRIFTWPFKKSYKAMMHTGMEKKQLVGKICQILAGLEKDEIGQAELVFNGTHYLLNVKSLEKIDKGETAILVEYNAEHELYLISEFQI